MNLFFMLALRHTSDPCNDVLVNLIDVLKWRNIHVDIGIAQDAVVQPDRLFPEHDLYILKSHSSLWLSLAGVLHEQGARILNPYPACITLENKIITTQRLKTAGVPVPDTWVTADLSLLLGIAEEKPLIVKPNTGGRGAGIYYIHHPEDLLSVPPSSQPLLVEEFIRGSGEDLKAYVIGDRVFGVRKPFSPNSFRTAGQYCSISPEIERIALACGRVFGLSLYGLDIIESPDGPVVVDLNYFPSYKGIPDAADLLADFIINYTYDGSPNLAFSESVKSAIDSC
jgi:ribosomal protein S6--L-glutamate ligase